MHTTGLRQHLLILEETVSCIVFTCLEFRFSAKQCTPSVVSATHLFRGGCSAQFLCVAISIFSARQCTTSVSSATPLLFWNRLFWIVLGCGKQVYIYNKLVTYASGARCGSWTSRTTLSWAQSACVQPTRAWHSAFPHGSTSF